MTHIHFPPRLINDSLNVRREKNQIYAFFERLADLQATTDLRDAYSSGWIHRAELVG